jgi:small GTP-binding protein
VRNRQKKVVLIGDFSVGKTSLIRRYVENSFSDTYLSTIGVKISKKNITVDDETILLLIWDIEGALDKIKRVNKTYIKGASAAIIVTDVTSTMIESTLQKHLDDIHSVNGAIPSMIAFNKIDKDESFTIDIDDILQKNSNIVGTFKTSAKSGKNVEKMFEVLVKEIIEC